MNNALAFGGAFMLMGALLILYFAILKVVGSRSS